MIALEEERARLPSGDGICWDRLLFSAKESVFKAWFPITGRWLGFKDAFVTMQPAGAFHARLLVPGPVIEGRVVTGFAGRYLATGTHVLTAVAVEAPGRRQS